MTDPHFDEAATRADLCRFLAACYYEPDAAFAEARKVLQLGSCIGREWNFEQLQSIFPEEEPILLAGIDQLLDKGIVHASGNGFTIRHALIQDASYDSMLRRTRQGYHAQIAAHLEQDTSGDTLPERIAQHVALGAVLARCRATGRGLFRHGGSRESSASRSGGCPPDQRRAGTPSHRTGAAVDVGRGTDHAQGLGRTGCGRGLSAGAAHQ